MLINKTETDIGLSIILNGCFTEAYGSSYETGISAASNQTSNKEVGWNGLDYIVFVQYIGNIPNPIGYYKLVKDNQTITAIVTFDGIDFIMEFV